MYRNVYFQTLTEDGEPNSFEYYPPAEVKTHLTHIGGDLTVTIRGVKTAITEVLENIRDHNAEVQVRMAARNYLQNHWYRLPEDRSGLPPVD